MKFNIPSKFQPFPVYYNTNSDFSTKALTFESIGNTTVCLSGGSGSLEKNPITMYYKKTGDASFNSYTVGTTISLSNGETVSFSGTTDVFSKVSGTPTSKTYGCYKFYTGGAGTLKLYGNVNSLINSTTILSYLHNGVFYNLFNDCQNIIDASNFVLPYMDLTWECYTQMFNACYSLTSAPLLPATGMASGCYNGMFQYCSSLLSAPVLPATDTTWGCYKYMFTNCKKLNAIDVNFTTWRSGTDKFTDWVYGVSGNGTFYKPTALPISTGYDYIPTGWTVVNKDATEPLTFESLVDNNTVRIAKTGNPYQNSLYYSMDGGETWSPYTLNEYVYLNNGDSVAFSGTGDHFSKDASNYYRVIVKNSVTNGLNVYGNIMSLVNGASALVDDYQFANLFNADTGHTGNRKGNIRYITGLILPENTTPYCYLEFLYGNSGFTDAFELPATTLTSGCYKGMFYGCMYLSSVSVSFTDWGDTENTSGWVDGVFTNGEFICPTALGTNASITRGISNCPSHWTVTNT